MFATGMNWVKTRLLRSVQGATAAEGAGPSAPADDGLGDYQSPGAHPILVQELTPSQFIALLAQRAGAA
jgi:hypothetical protein